MEDKCFEKISAEAKHLVSKLLMIDPFHRPSADQSLSHPWMHQKLLSNKTELVNIVQDRLIENTRHLVKGLDHGETDRSLDDWGLMLKDLTRHRKLSLDESEITSYDCESPSIHSLKIRRLSFDMYSSTNSVAE